MNTTAVLRSSELLLIENNLIERSKNRLEHITQAGLATAAYLRTICSERPLHFFVTPGRKGVIALTAAIELHQSDPDSDLVITLIDSQDDDQSIFAQVFARVPASLLQQKDPKKRAVVIDAMYGFDHSLADSQNQYLEKIAAYSNLKIAIETPSGVEVDTGRRAPVAIDCDKTIAFIMPLVCHTLMPGRGLCGTVHLCDVGVEEEDIDRVEPEFSCNTTPDFSDILPVTSDHKYSRGTTAIIASDTMPGAAYLAAAAAQRCSIGAVFVLAPPKRVSYFQTLLPSAIVVECKSPREILDMLTDDNIGSIVAGPGLLEIRKDSGQLYEILALDKPTIVDASALDALRSIAGKLPARENALVITPHQGEFGRLFPQLRKEHPLLAIQCAASLLNASVLLKGFTTLIAASDGRVMFNINARSELAVAGSGDVLAGMIGALLCHYADGYQACNFAAWWHSAAGRGFGLIAEDIIRNLQKVAEMELDS